MFWIINSKMPKRSSKAESRTKPTDYPGMWRIRTTNPNDCCIYRVPASIRRVNPEAYTPQLVLIGPLNHSLKSQALNSVGDITDTKSMGYLNMEEHKKIYLQIFKQEFGLGKYRRVIEDNEEKIRESYSDSTTWIKSSEFVDMILRDCVFILLFIIHSLTNYQNKTGDPLIDEPCLQVTVYRDLMLLENQLPYFILNELFHTRFPVIFQGETFRQLVIKYFGLVGKIGDNTNFIHFTDLKRCARTETLKELTPVESYKSIEHMYNAEKLYNGGVKFEATENELSLDVRFENGCLKIPRLFFYDETEMELRNVMALEQCHYPIEAHVCNYIHFMDFLIDTDKDVDLLVHKGVVKNWIGQPSLVADMVNKLNIGIVEVGSDYYETAVKLNAHNRNRYQKSKAILKRVYFGNVWIGTATVAAGLLLLMTLIQTVFTIIN